MRLPCTLNAARNRIRNTNTFVGQFSLAMGANVLVAVTGLATGLLSARLLGPHGRGELAAIQSWVLLFGALATMGMSEAVVYFVGQNPAKGGRYVITAQALNILPGVVFIVAGWWLMPLLLNAQSAEIVAAARWYLVMMIPLFLAFGWFEVLRSLQAWRAWTILKVLPNSVWVIILLIAFAVPVLASPVTLILLFPIIFLFQLVPALVIARHSLMRPLQFDQTLALPLAKFGIPAMLTVLPQALNLNLDQLLMAMFLEPSMLGLYVVAVVWSGAPLPAIMAVAQVLFPRLSAIHTPKAQFAILTKVLGITFFAILLLYSLLFILTPIALPLLFGAAYQPGVEAARVLVVASGFRALNVALGSGLYGLGRPKFVLMTQMLGLGITVIVLALLLSTLGIMGAAIASLLSYMGICIGLVFAVWRARYLSLREVPPELAPVRFR